MLLDNSPLTWNRNFIPDGERSVRVTAYHSPEGRADVLNLLVTAGLSQAGATPAHATDNSANVTRFTVTSTETFEGALPECFLPDLVGTNVATDTVTGQWQLASNQV